MPGLTFDLRDALKTLRRDPAYAATVVLTLALTIGATTAVFSIVDGVLLRPLAYPDSRRLVLVREIAPPINLYPSVPANPRHFAIWRTRSRSFEQLAELQTLPQALTGAGEPLQLEVVFTTGNLFDVLGARAAIGRTLRVDDERRDGEPVIVLTDRLWRQRFGGDPGVLGRPVTLDGARRTVVGVLERGFQFPQGEDVGGLAQSVSAASVPDAFVPLRIDPEEFSANGEYNYLVLGKLASGVSVEQALAELDVLQTGIAETLTHRPGLRARVVPLVDAVVGQARRGLVLLFGAIVAVLLIACANLANLSLTRALARGRDAAVRVALGASRARLVSRMVMEQLALATAGGGLGLCVAYAALGVFVRTAPIDLPRVGEVGMNLRVLAFAAGVSIATALLVAIAPAWRVVGRAGAGGSLQPLLRAGGLATTGDRGGMRTRAALLATQVALSVTLLAVTLLFARSFVRVMRVDRGFAVDHVLAVDATLPGARYAAAEPRTRAYDRILDEVRALPGVRAASWISNLPLTGESWVDLILPREWKEVGADLPLANYRFVGPEFFETLSIPIRHGRSLTAADLDVTRATTAAVVSERAAARLWPGVDPIGRRFTRGNSDEKPFEIVGVAPDGHPTDLERVPETMVYVPYSVPKPDAGVHRDSHSRRAVGARRRRASGDLARRS